MNMYHFTMEVSGVDTEIEGLAEGLFYETGIDDALLYVSDGHLFLAFDREARNQEDANLSAERDIDERGGKVTRIIIEARP
jgi:hypothetical protein